MRDESEMSFDGDWFNVLWEQLALNSEMGAVTDVLRRERAAMRFEDILAGDSLDAALTELQTVGVEFARIARTPEQLALVGSFQKAVHGLTHMILPAMKDLLQEKGRPAA